MESPKRKNIKEMELAEMKRLFKKYDSNSDGKIDEPEMDRLLREILSRAGVEVNADLTKIIWEAFDADKSKEVDQAEFVYIVEKYNNPLIRKDN